MKSLLLLVLLSLVEVHCQQTFPYVSFMGQTLANHSYMDISQVGNNGSGSSSDFIQCHTDLVTCCSGAQGGNRGDWYFPNGIRLLFYSKDGFFEARKAQRLELRHRNNANEPTGIYRCDIETNAVRDNGMRETVYMGLYTSDGGKYFELLIVGVYFVAAYKLSTWMAVPTSVILLHAEVANSPL